MKNLRKGFTLVEIMIVVLIIGVLMAIAIPNFLNARTTAQTKACVANLKQIQSATEQNLMQGAKIEAISDLVGDSKPLKATPVCPASGTYTIGTSTTNPTCSVSGHAL